MKQNIYDNLDFFSKYNQMPRSVHGLKAAGEWHAFQSLFPDLQGKRVLDLGCGFGWHCRYVREHQAASVLGLDLSEKMLEVARKITTDDKIEYKQAAIEDLNFKNEFDLVISSLAFHYVEKFDDVCKKVYGCLKVGGSFIFSVEHPMFTSRESQDWFYDEDGKRLHWPVDHYQEEGIRHTSWLADDVIKYHRTLSTYVNNLLSSGFRITKMIEPEPTTEMVNENPEFKDESRRPMFLLISAVKEI